MSAKEPVTINDWQRMFEQIYGQKNQDLSLEALCLHLVEEVGEVAKDLRKEHFERLRKDLPDVFAWLCAFCNCAGINLEDAIWQKYPKVCPYCLKANNCICIAGTYDKVQKGRLANHVTSKMRPKDLNDWQAMFRTIYGNVNTIVMTPGVGLHLMEEIGELARNLRRDSADETQLNEGVADVFAWIMALAMKHINASNAFHDAVWQVYPGFCPKCSGQTVCQCALPTRMPRN